MHEIIEMSFVEKDNVFSIPCFINKIGRNNNNKLPLLKCHSKNLNYFINHILPFT